MSRRLAFSYVRFSSAKQGRGSSFFRQTQDTAVSESPETWCARNDVTLDDKRTFRDLGRSAFKGECQRELLVFLEMVKNGTIPAGSYLLVEKVDRISRKGVDKGMEVIKQILRAGVHIVTLMNGRVYGPDALDGLMKGLLELQFYLEQAHEFSKTLSARVRGSWEFRRKRARERKALATAVMPPWLRADGEGDDRHAVEVPERVAVVRHIFRMAIEGKGTTRIVRELLEGKVEPLTRRKSWNKTSVRRVLTDRTVLGEYQPMRGTSGDRAVEGQPIEGYYPAVIDLDTFNRARACMTKRKAGGTRRAVGRSDKNVNVFSGLLRDARNGLTYQHTLRVEADKRRHYVLQSAVKTGGTNSFPFDVFERAVLSLLREVDPRDVMPAKPDADRSLVDTLKGELEAVRADIAEAKNRLAKKFSQHWADMLDRYEDKERDVKDRLVEANFRAASPVEHVWTEAKSLLETVASAEDVADARLRLRAAIRRVVEVVNVLVVGRGRDRLALVQVVFAGGESYRNVLIVNRPPKSNGRARVEGAWVAITFDHPGSSRAGLPFLDDDLRNEPHGFEVETAEDWMQRMERRDLDRMLSDKNQYGNVARGVNR